MITKHLNLFKYLNDAKVDYLLVGGVAAIIYGVPRSTQDIDIVIKPELENAKRLLEALKQFGFGTAELTSPDEIIANEITIFKDFLRLDVLTKLKLFSFEEVFSNHEVIEAEHILIPLISNKDLIEEKKAAGRNIDQEDLKVLLKS
ncbi:MAG: DUF6036 family nucleotidyltransferase [Pseudomonadota bacterium]